MSNAKSYKVETNRKRGREGESSSNSNEPIIKSHLKIEDYSAFLNFEVYPRFWYLGNVVIFAVLRDSIVTAPNFVTPCTSI